ncbi:hypothetical protein JX265_009619, partial [Neoarthrinium moseri]
MKGSWCGLVVVAWSVASSWASPLSSSDFALHSSSETDLMIRRGIELAHTRELEKRLSEEFSMDKTWDNETLFGGSWTDDVEDATGKTALSVVCLHCYTKGTVTARLWEDLFHPTVRLEFDQVEAYAFLGVETSASGTFSINLFASQSPIGLAFPGLSVGVVFFVDLVFSLSEQIDLTGGFYVRLADDAYLEADIFGGDITDSFFDGISSKSIPVTVKSGSATFKADLRLRVQCGAETSLDIIGIGSGAVVGIYANIIEFVAVLDSTPDCALQAREWWDLNVGAYAHLDVVVDYTTIGPVPTVSTTLLTAPTMTQCLIEASASSTLTATLPETAATTRTTTASQSGREGTSAYSSSALQSSSWAETSTSPSTYSYLSETSSITSPPGLSTSAPPSVASSSRYPLINSTTTSANDTGLVTSTIYSTTAYTLTRCAADVINCPASYQTEVVVTRTLDVYTTVCPASAQVATTPLGTPLFSSPSSPSASTLAALATPTAVHIVTDQVVMLTPCATPIVDTFVPPPVSTAPVVEHIAVAGYTSSASTGHLNQSITSSVRPQSSSATKPSFVASHGTGSKSVALFTQAPMTAGAVSNGKSVLFASVFV